MAPEAAVISRADVANTDLVVDLSRFASSIDIAGLDPAVIEAVKTNIFDTLGCALAGSSAKAIAEVTGLVREWGGAEQADMFVFGGKFPAHHAAFANGGMCHARDYDDTHDTAVLHAGVTAVPAAIAAGQLRGGLSGADLIAAVAAGSLRPSIARAIVTSSAYSMSLPAGTPVAMRVMRTGNLRSAVASQSAVASPSAVGLIARITSSTSPRSTRLISVTARNWSGTHAMERRKRSMEHVIDALVPLRALHRINIGRLLHHAHQALVPA